MKRLLHRGVFVLLAAVFLMGCARSVLNPDGTVAFREAGFFGLHLEYTAPDGTVCRNTSHMAWPRLTIVNGEELPAVINTDAGPVRLLCQGKELREVPPGGQVTIANAMVTYFTATLRGMPTYPVMVSYIKSNAWYWTMPYANSAAVGSDVGLSAMYTIGIGGNAPFNRYQYGERYSREVKNYREQKN